MGNKKHTAALLLGGNIGDTEGIFRKARRRLQGKMDIDRVSSIYKTEAWGMEGADDFLNQALVVSTEMAPIDLLKETAAIEEELGRERKGASNTGYESRQLDIDLLLYDQEIINTPELAVPHPKMHLRNFTLLPLAEIAGDWEHPVFNKSVEALLLECPDKLSAKRI